MASKYRTPNPNFAERFENLSKVLQTSRAVQTRFQLIPQQYLNKVTVAGIRDITLGKIKNGKPVGGNIIRVNYPCEGTNSNFNRICIDPAGVSNKNNLHIPVSKSFVKTAEFTQRNLGKVLFVISVVASTVRICKTIYDEIHIDDEIESLKEMINCLEEDLNDSSLTSSKRKKTEEALDYTKELLRKAKDYERKPGKKVFVDMVCIGGGYGGAFALGSAGCKAGIMIGSAGGPVCAFIGAITGSIVGATIGSEFCQSAIKNFKCDNTGIGTKAYGSLINCGKDLHCDAGALGSKASIGDNGLEVSAGTTLFELSEDGNSFAVGKAGTNLDITSDGLEVGAGTTLYGISVDNESLAVGKAGANFDITNDGLEVGAGTTLFEFSDDNGSLAVGKVGANFDITSDGLEVGAGTTLYGISVDNESLAVGKAGANFDITNDGLEVGAGTTLFELSDDNNSFAVGKAGANFDITDNGVDVGVEGKIVRTEIKSEDVDIGFGLNLDTGIKMGKDGVKVEALGFGFSADDGGVSFKLPFFDIKFK